MKFLSSLLNRILESYSQISDAIDVGNLSSLSAVDLGIMNYSTGDSLESRRIIGEMYKPIPKEWESLMTNTIPVPTLAPALTSVVIVEKTRKAA